jgi:hypothetical protein
MELELVVGSGRAGIGDGGGIEARGNRLGELVVSDGLPRFAEWASRGKVWVGTTAAAGVAPGTAIGTSPAFYLHNPIGSGTALVPIGAWLGYVSGTLGAGSLVYTTNQGAQASNPTGGTAITPQATLLAGGNTTAVGKCFTGSTTATQSLVRPTGIILQASLASTAVAPVQIRDGLDGEFVIAPGYGLGIQGIAAAGSSPLVLLGMSWLEIPIAAVG